VVSAVVQDDDPTVPARISAAIATELGVGHRQVDAAVALLDGGATVPFVARYRKEATGGLDDVQLRALEQQLGYRRELEERRTQIRDSIRTQGKLDAELAARIEAADSKARLEDIYLPYRPKRRTKAQIAREAGLEPLADLLLSEPDRDPERTAEGFLSPDNGIADSADALVGARAILVERFTEDPDLIGELRERFWSTGRLTATVRDGKQQEGAKFADYFDFSEPFTLLPSHRILALLRGEKEEILSLGFEPEPEEDRRLTTGSTAERRIAAAFSIADRGRPADRWLGEVVRWAWRTRILPRLALDVRSRLWQTAEDEAVGVFAENLRALLLAAPAGSRTTMGLDPGFRTGVKVAVVDGTGKVVATDTIYPHPPQHRQEQALRTLIGLAREHCVELVAIGNGTASRETDRLVTELRRSRPELGLVQVMVSEAGASVYSASAYASEELPELDVSLRGAVSIARRLQDPLAELVKIEPRSIGVGQYQHDLSAAQLSRSLNAVVEDCVNAVGVDVNTASVPLLHRVSGISEHLAEAIVARRDTHGPFRSRRELASVPRLGPKSFEQCAGFLRIRGGTDPMDASSVHPEAYPVVRRISAHTGLEVTRLIGDTRTLDGLSATDFTDDTFGVPTVEDILTELRKPGRDPRPAFTTASFAEGIETVADLSPGLVLEGVVTNVAAFGAFVDIGVHQDGLVHISAMSRRFVSDPRKIVNPGDVVRVKVLQVDLDRNRISLTLRLDDEVPGPAGTPAGDRAPTTSSGGRRRERSGQHGRPQRDGRPTRDPKGRQEPDGAMAEAFRRAGMGTDDLGVVRRPPVDL
jgi:uncharacterized protein